MTTKELYKLLNERELKICILGHKNPDGDAIGSALALYHYLFLKHHQVHIIMPDPMPQNLYWLKGTDRILNYMHHRAKCKKFMDESDLNFCLDFNSISRTGDIAELLRESKGKRLMIDHHPGPAFEEFELAISDSQASATAELIYQFICSAGDKDLINKAIAEALFTGIMTDTGSFAYSCKHAAPFEITAELIKKGLDVRKVHDLVFNTNTESRLRLLGHSLSNCLTVIPDYRTAYIALNSDDLQRYGYQKGDTEGLVNYALSIKGIVFAVFLSHREGIIRLSFRSKGNFSVNDFARRHFDGGGHRNAAGGNSSLSMDETISEFLNLLEKYSDELRED